MTTATGNNMHNEAQPAIGIGLIASLITFFSGLTVTEWAAVIGIFGTIITVTLAVMRFLEERQLRKLDMALKRRALQQEGGH